MNKEWIELYDKEIEKFAEQTKAFHDQEMTRKEYKGISGGMGSPTAGEPILYHPVDFLTASVLLLHPFF